MNVRTLLHTTTLIGCSALALCAAAVPAAAQHVIVVEPAAPVTVRPEMPEERMQNGIAYRAGGVGIEVREQMEQAADDYNLRLSFAASADRHYVSDVRVAIKDANGRTLLDVREAGPLFYASLPPGTYRVEVTYGGTTKTQTMSIDDGMARANFLWQESHSG